MRWRRWVFRSFGFGRFGFGSFILALMPVTEALSAILAGAEPLPEETVALDAAYHRVLAHDLAALRTQPPQAMSAMDGYAVRAADASRAATQFMHEPGDYDPLARVWEWAVIGEAEL